MGVSTFICKKKWGQKGIGVIRCLSSHPPKGGGLSHFGQIVTSCGLINDVEVDVFSLLHISPERKTVAVLFDRLSGGRK